MYVEGSNILQHFLPPVTFMKYRLLLFQVKFSNSLVDHVLCRPCDGRLADTQRCDVHNILAEDSNSGHGQELQFYNQYINTEMKIQIHNDAKLKWSVKIPNFKIFVKLLIHTFPNHN